MRMRNADTKLQYMDLLEIAVCQCRAKMTRKRVSEAIAQ